MSGLSKATGINIDLLHNAQAKSSSVIQAATTSAVQTTETAAGNAFVTAAGTIVAEIAPSVITTAETAINGLLISHGLAATTDEADALIESELAKLGL